MKLISSLTILGAALLLIGCGTTVQTTMNKSWEKEVTLDESGTAGRTQIYLEDDREAVTLVSPAGVQTFDSKGAATYKVDREKLFRVYIHTTRGAEELTDKITYIYLPHRHSLLEFNYSMAAETVTMINLESREIAWINNDLKWSLERYQKLVRAASTGFSLMGAATADAASQILMPKRFVRNLTMVVPQLDAMLFKTMKGLQLISLKNGKVLWTNKEIDGGIAKMEYYPASNSILVVNSDEFSGIQINKQIARIDAQDGSTIWSNSYDGNIRRKLDGIGIWADREVDVRLLNDVVMINFLNVELYDFETGKQLWQTTEGANDLLDMVAPEAQIMNLFAFPVIHDDILYRVGFENVGLTGVDVIIEAYELYTGELVWKSDKISRSDPVNNMEVVYGNLIVSTATSEGIIAFDAQNGERIWAHREFGRKGVQHDMHTVSGGILAAGKDKLVLLNPESGKEIYTINTGDNIGTIMDFVVEPYGVALSGSNGFAVYDEKDGKQLQQISTPTGGLIETGNKRLLIRPKPNYGDAAYPVDGAFYVIQPEEGELKGILGTDSSRRSWEIGQDYERMVVLTGDKIIMYEAR